MADIEPGGHWSHPLSRDLGDCHRRVYYRVYGSWGGWTRQGNPVAHMLYQAKYSNSLSTYVESLVHQAIGAILHRVSSRRAIASSPLMVQRIEERMRCEIETSAQGAWRRIDNPRRATLILRPHLHDRSISKAQINEAIHDAQEALSAFLDACLPAFQQRPHDIGLIDRLDSIEYRQTSLFISPDAVMHGPPWALFDWTTNPDIDTDRLEANALYLIEWEEREHLHTLDASNITGQLVTLCDLSKTQRVTMSEPVIAAARARIDADIDTLQSLHSSGLSRDEAAFPKTQDTNHCTSCAFRFHCERDRRSS